MLIQEFQNTRILVSQTVLENITTDRTFGPIVFTATAADIKFAFAPAGPIRVYRFGILAQTAFTVGSFRLTLGQYDQAVANLVAGTTVTLTPTVDFAAGKGVYRDVLVPVAQTTINAVGIGGQVSNVKPVGPLTIFPGQSVGIALTTVATAGTGRLFIEYAELPQEGFEFLGGVVGPGAVAPTAVIMTKYAA